MNCYYLTIILLIFFLISSSYSSDANDESSPLSDSSVVNDSLETTVNLDTLLFIPTGSVPIASKVTNPINFEKYLQQEPTVALFKSMFVPGLGQFGNKRYTKTAIVVGLQSWFITSAVYYGKQASDARSNLDKANSSTERIELFNFYDNKRKNRNKFIWFAGIVTFISMFDAYVDAHLSGSPSDIRNEGFSFDITPATAGGVNASLSYSF